MSLYDLMIVYMIGRTYFEVCTAPLKYLLNIIGTYTAVLTRRKKSIATAARGRREALLLQLIIFFKD